MVTKLSHREIHPHPATPRSGLHTGTRRSGLHLGRLAAVLGTLTCALLSFSGAVPAAFAAQIPVPGPAARTDPSRPARRPLPA